jgi:methylase of polypeptide subunit release factors
MTAAIPAETPDWHGLRLAVTEGVLPPWSSSEAMVRTMADIRPCRRNGTVVDVGCGSGVLGLFAALTWPRTTAVLIDVDPVAAQAATRNVALSARRLEDRGSRVVVLCADGLSAVAPGLCPDVVLCNLPFDPGLSARPGDDGWGSHARSVRDPGYAAHIRVLADLAARLRPGARVLMASSPSTRDSRLPGDLVRGSGLHLVNARTFWFHAPWGGDPDARRAYRISILERVRPGVTGVAGAAR